LLIDSPLPELRIRPLTALAVSLPLAAITTFLVIVASRARRNKKTAGPESVVGKVGTAVEDLNPSGRIFTHGEYWFASAVSPIKAGEKVKITSIRGLELTVDKIGSA
jgi:membrane-bound serine protease (ClpP class)